MTLTDMIVIAVIGLIVGGAVAYIVKAKKNGKRCIGCPYADACSTGKGGRGCGCGGNEE